jgi:hypothetical protein
MLYANSLQIEASEAPTLANWPQIRLQGRVDVGQCAVDRTSVLGQRRHVILRTS